MVIVYVLSSFFLVVLILSSHVFGFFGICMRLFDDVYASVVVGSWRAYRIYGGLFC